MSPIPDPPEENFDEAAKKFNLEKLRADLEAAKHGRITEAPWRYFKGVLCEHDTKEIATKEWKINNLINYSGWGTAR